METGGRIRLHVGLLNDPKRLKYAENGKQQQRNLLNRREKENTVVDIEDLDEDPFFVIPIYQ